MPRRNRCVLPGAACHVTQRGVDRMETFSSSQDYLTYLGLLRDNMIDAGVRVLAYCLMTNHVHLVLTPEREDSLSVLLRRVHGRYAQYYNIKSGRTGHLWQSRFFACVLQRDHLWRALAYVEQNPVRAGISSIAVRYPWSSAMAHAAVSDPSGVLDMAWWAEQGAADWRHLMGARNPDSDTQLQRCTYSGRPFGDEAFVGEMSERFGRYWKRGRPAKQPKSKAATSGQGALF
jgi:putative transposase